MEKVMKAQRHKGTEAQSKNSIRAGIFLKSSFPNVLIGNPVPHRFLACTLSLLLAHSPLTTAFAADTKRQITLTTYYPAPFGSYERVQTGKGVTPAAPGDMAVQRQLKVGRNPDPTTNNFGQAVININVTATPADYLYGGTTVFYKINSDAFWNAGWNPDKITVGSDTGLPLDLAVAGHTRISGQGKAALAGYIDVLPWTGVNQDAQTGGEITLRGKGGGRNWSTGVYQGGWRLRADVDQPLETLGDGTTGAWEQLRASGGGNIYMGKMYDSDGTHPQLPDKVGGGSLFVGTGALLRSNTGDNDLWSGAIPAAPGIYSIDNTVNMNFVVESTTFSWFSGGMAGVNPAGLEMSLHPNNGLTIEDGLLIKGKVGTNATDPSLEVYGGGDILLKGSGSDPGDLVFKKNDGTELGRVWSDPDGIQKLYLRGGSVTTGLTIDSPGNVGIGTTSPETKLDVRDANGGYTQLNPGDGALELGSGNDATSYIDFKGNANLETDYQGRIIFTDGVGFGIEGGKVGIGTTNPGAQLDLADIYGSGGKNLLIGDDAYLSDIDIANTLGVYGNQDNTIASLKLGSGGGTISGFNGNVGIGTTNPVAKLDVRDANGGYTQLSPGDGALELGSGNDATSYIDFKGNANLETDYQGRIIFTDGVGFGIEGGKVGIGTTNPDAQLHLADIYGSGGKNLLIGDDAYLSDIDIANTLGVYGNQDNTIASLKLGSGGGTISGFNGNVGIGTTSPSNKLHVVGNVLFQNDLAVYDNAAVGDVLRVGTIAGNGLPPLNSVGGAYNPTDATPGLHVYGDLLIRQGALSNGSVISEDMATYGSLGMPLPASRKNDASGSQITPGLTADYVDGYSSEELLANARGVRYGSIGSVCAEAAALGTPAYDKCVMKIWADLVGDVTGRGRGTYGGGITDDLCEPAENIDPDVYRKNALAGEPMCDTGANYPDPNKNRCVVVASRNDNSLWACSTYHQYDYDGVKHYTNMSVLCLQNQICPTETKGMTSPIGVTELDGGGGGAEGGGGEPAPAAGNIPYTFGSYFPQDLAAYAADPFNYNNFIYAPSSSTIAMGSISNRNIKANSIFGEWTDTDNNGSADGLDSTKSAIAAETITGWNIKNGTITGGLAGAGDIGTETIKGGLDANDGNIANDTITTWNIKNGSIKAEDLEPDITIDIANGSIHGGGTGGNDAGANNEIGRETITGWNVEAQNIYGGINKGNSFTAALQNRPADSDIALDTITGGTAAGAGNIAGGTITGWNVTTTDADALTGANIKDFSLGTSEITDFAIKGDAVDGVWGDGGAPGGNGQIDMNTITGWNIANGSIAAEDLATDSVVGGAGGVIQDGSIASADMNWTDFVGTNGLSNGTGRITGSHIQNGTITGGRSCVFAGFVGGVPVWNCTATGDIALDSISGSVIDPNYFTGTGTVSVSRGATGVFQISGTESADVDSIGGQSGMIDVSTGLIMEWNGATGRYQLRNTGVITESADVDSIGGRGGVIDVSTGLIMEWNGATGRYQLRNTGVTSLDAEDSTPCPGGGCSATSSIGGDVVLRAGTDIDITRSGSTITIAYRAGSGGPGFAPSAFGAMAAPNSITGDTGGAIASETITGWNIKNGSIGHSELALNSVDSGKIVDGSVTSADIADGSVAWADLAIDSVDSSKIKDGEIKLADLAPDSVDSSKLKDGGIMLVDLAVNSVDSTKIVDNSVTTSDIANNTILKEDFASDLVNGLVWNSSPLVADMDANSLIDRVDKADTASYVVISDNGVKKRCKIKKISVNYLSGLEENQHSDTLPTGSGVDTYVDSYYTYTPNESSLDVLTFDTYPEGHPQAGQQICEEFKDWT